MSRALAAGAVAVLVALAYRLFGKARTDFRDRWITVRAQAVGDECDGHIDPEEDKKLTFYARSGYERRPFLLMFRIAHPHSDKCSRGDLRLKSIINTENGSAAFDDFRGNFGPAPVLVLLPRQDLPDGERRHYEYRLELVVDSNQTSEVDPEIEIIWKRR